MTFQKKSLVDYLAFAFCFLFLIAGVLVSLHRYWQYEVSYVDFGQYDQAIWKVSRFQAPEIYHFIHKNINVLGDHATPSIFLLSPLYWITDRSEIILIAQALAVALSGFFLYDIARHVLKNKLLALSILVSYFLFVGLQNAVITEFHELTVMTLPLMLALWAIVKNKISLYFASFIIMLGFKEITFALGIGIGIALILLKKEWRRYGIITIALSLLWAFIAFKIILPHFSNGEYLYITDLPNGLIDKVAALTDHPIKRNTLLFSFLSFSFLPFFAPQFWLTLLQDYASRFMPLYFTTRWDLGLHYNAQSAVILAISSVFGLRYLLRFAFVKINVNIIAFLIIINAFVLFRFILHGPFLLAINPAFYNHTNDFKFLNEMVEKIPKGTKVMTQNNLAPRFSHQDVRLFTLEYATFQPDYVVLDMRAGQSPNNFLGSKNVDGVLSHLRSNTSYKIVYQTRDQFIFKKQ